MKKDHSYDAQIKNGIYGPLDWFLKVPENKRSGAVLFGRMLALYDHVTGSLSMLPVYTDPDNRGMALARIGNWLDDQSKRVKQAYSRICIDCSGMGRNEILSRSFDMDLFAEWYELQKEALDCADTLRSILHKIWGGNTRDMIMSLAIPGNVMQAYNTYLWPMGPDVCACVRAAFIPMIRTVQGFDLYKGDDWDNRYMPEKWEDTAEVRQEFINAWRLKEDELLALPVERRQDIWEN